MASKRHVGTSGFTHQDDASAPIHTTDPNHLEAHVFGGPAPDEERETVVLGPPAYGSPDVRTLGHSVNPGMDGRSAPELDSEFRAIQATGDAVTEDDLQQMNKRDLIAFAEANNIEVKSSMTKDEILDVIKDEGNVADDEEDESTTDDDDDEESEDDDDNDDSGNAGQ
jgi:hypothetical protein